MRGALGKERSRPNSASTSWSWARSASGPRDVASGGQLTIERDNDKNPVVALREIADETIDLDGLRNNLIQGLQHNVEQDEPEEEGGFGAETADLLGEMIQAQEKDATEAGLSVDGEFQDEPAADGEDVAEEK